MDLAPLAGRRLTMRLEDLVVETGHERVVRAEDEACGYRAIIAIHDTRLGPAIGGTRRWPYVDHAAALTDALRLSRAMTWKCAAAGLPFGGGKAVIIDVPGTDRAAVYRAHGRAVQALGGRFITAEDVGTTPADLQHVRAETSFVAGLADGVVGDPGPFTAHGVVQGMRASAMHRWSSPDLSGRRVAIQGCGGVGASLARELASLGAQLWLADLDEARVTALARELRAEVVSPREVLRQPCDILAPCALGAVLDLETIRAMQADIVCGGANNQLATPGDGARLAARGVLYAPDFVVNAGGVISGTADVLGWSIDDVRRRIDGIADTLRAVFQLADAERITTQEAAELLAERRLGAGIAA